MEQQQSEIWSTFLSWNDVGDENDEYDYLLLRLPLLYYSWAAALSMLLCRWYPVVLSVGDSVSAMVVEPVKDFLSRNFGAKDLDMFLK